MSNWCKAALCAAIFAALTTSAFADDSLAGEWVFQSVNDEIGCTIAGRATLTHDANADTPAYRVAMRAAQTCGGVQTSESSETCAATRKSGAVVVSCRVVESTAPGYLPDDFILTERNPDLMVGRLTANWNAPAEWRRARAAPVS
jgi:hypothetical protein